MVGDFIIPWFSGIGNALKRIFGMRNDRKKMLDRINNPKQRPFDDVAFAAIAIRSFSADQRHLGILYREKESAPILMLHLAWHHDLRSHSPKDDYVWIDPAVNRRRLRQVAVLCRQVLRANQGSLPYGFSPPNDCFDENTGKYLIGPTRHGLTCATFVLAVFQRAGISLACYKTWPVGRSGDKEWQERIVSALEANNASGAHVQAVKAEIATVRFRPEEVAGAAIASPLPADFKAAETHAKRILDELAKL